MRFLKYGLRVLGGLAYLAIVIGILSAASTRFETLVLAGMVQIYATLLYNFSVIGVVTDVNNRAGLVRFKILYMVCTQKRLARNTPFVSV